MKAMQSRIHLFGVAFVSSIALLVLTSSPARACTYGQIVAPSTDTRTYENEQLGISFQFPANYRAVGARDGEVQIMSPTDFEYIQCLARRDFGGEGGWFASAIISSQSVTPGNRSLEQIVRDEYFWIETRIQTVNEGGKEVAILVYTDEHDGIFVASIFFLTGDGQRLVEIMRTKR